MATGTKQANFAKVLQESFGAWKDERHPELARGTRQFVRSLRKSARLKRWVVLSGEQKSPVRTCGLLVSLSDQES